MDRLELPFERRQKSRQLARLASGEQVGLVVERGRVMRGGDVVKTVDGRDVQIVAANPKATPAQLESALGKLRSGQSLDPSRGTETLSYEASLEIRLHRFPEALRSLGEIVRREPDTAEAWFLIVQLSRGSDPAQAARAQAQLRRLDPRQARNQR